MCGMLAAQPCGSSKKKKAACWVASRVTAPLKWSRCWTVAASSPGRPSSLSGGSKGTTHGYVVRMSVGVKSVLKDATYRLPALLLEEENEALESARTSHWHI